MDSLIVEERTNLACLFVCLFALVVTLGGSWVTLEFALGITLDGLV